MEVLLVAQVWISTSSIIKASTVESEYGTAQPQLVYLFIQSHKMIQKHHFMIRVTDLCHPSTYWPAAAQ